MAIVGARRMLPGRRWWIHQFEFRFRRVYQCERLVLCELLQIKVHFNKSADGLSTADECDLRLATDSGNNLRDRGEDVFAVDNWLWFLAVENLFVDDNSYWNKGADYGFYYEPECGRIHPVELCDEPNNPRKWQVPAGTTISANGYLLVRTDEDTREADGLHASFKLSASNEESYLTDTDANLNQVLNTICFGTQRTEVSYGRTAANSDVWSTMSPTPGADDK